LVDVTAILMVLSSAGMLVAMETKLAAMLVDVLDTTKAAKTVSWLVWMKVL